MRAHADTPACTCTHTNTHTHTHTNTQTLTRTHTDTHLLWQLLGSDVDCVSGMAGKVPAKGMAGKMPAAFSSTVNIIMVHDVERTKISEMI